MEQTEAAPVPQQQQTYTQSPFYQHLNRIIFHGESEKSFIDKILGRQDADKLHELIKKEPLTLSDVEEILFLMTSIDQKLLNYDEWDRYIMVKLFPWIKHFSIICKQYMIYEKQYTDGDFNEEFTDKNIMKETENNVKEGNKILLHYFKYLISTFWLIGNSTLSIQGAGFDTILTQRYEYSYPTMQLPAPQDRRTGWNPLRRK